MDTLFLIILATAPGLALFYFILYMDRNEKEPLGLVIKTMLLGAISLAPVAIIEKLIGFAFTDIHSYSGAVLKSFLGVAWIEEFFKLGIVLIFAWPSKHFNEENDGIVYTGSTALGFAMLENLSYVLGNGYYSGIIRAITSMPLHCFSGILMGYCVGLAKVSKNKKTRNKSILKGFLLAFLVHGIYDSLLQTNSSTAVLIIPLISILVIFGFITMRKGRSLSIIRWDESLRNVSPEVRHEILLSVDPKNQVWKIIISRTLLILSLIFWMGLISLLIFEKNQFHSETSIIILGSITFSFLPILIGLMLEVSYQRKLKIFRNLQEAEQEEKKKNIAKPTTRFSHPGVSSIHPEAEIFPPGQLWRIIISRSLLTISGLYWTILLLIIVSNTREYENQWYHLVMSGFSFSFFPIYFGFILEDSYHKRKKRFDHLRKTMDIEDISSNAIALSPRGQLWKIIISRIIFGFISLFWLLCLWDSLIIKKFVAAQFFESIIHPLLITSLPIFIAVILELSYRSKKREFDLDRTING